MKNSILSLLFKLLFTVAILFYVATVIPFGSLFTSISKAKLAGLFVAFLLFLLSKYFSAKRLSFLFSTTGIRMPGSYQLKLYLLGMFYNLFLPGGVGGDAYKGYLLNKQFGYDPKILTRHLITDRMSGLAALGALVLGIGCFLPEIPLRHFLLAGVALLYAFYYSIMYFLSPTKTIYYEAESYSLLVQLSQLACAAVLLFSVGTITAFLPYLFLFLLSSVASILPFTLGGLGAREATFVLAAPYFPIEVDTAVCLGLLFYALTVAGASLGGLYVFYPEKLYKPYDGKCE